MTSTRSTIRRGLMGLIVATASYGCDAPSAFDVEMPDGTHIDLDEGFALNDGESVPLTVNVRDAAGNPMDVTLRWSTANTDIATVSASGVVTGRRPGTTTVTASAGLTKASTDVVVRQVPLTLEYVAGANQQAEENQTLDEPLTVRLLDRHGDPVPGVTVEFDVTAGGGSAQPASTTTDASGVARTAWTVGAAGDQEVVGVAQPPAHVESIADPSVEFSAVVVDVSDPDPTPTPPQAPSGVTDLQVVSTTEGTATLRFTAVSDGNGGGAKYAVRSGSPTLSWSAAYPSEQTIPASAVGSVVSYTYTGLEAGTEYEFRLVSYRGTLNQDAVFGSYSNMATGETDGGSTPPPTPSVTSVTASPSSYTFTQLGATTQITAVARDANNNVVQGAELTYTSSAPSIVSVDQMGRMTAHAAGVATIVVASVCCDASASVQTTVNPVTPTPPSGVWRANEPGGMSIQYDAAFGDPLDSNFYGATPGTAQNVLDPSAPFSGDRVARFNIPGSYTDGGTGASHVTLPSGTVRIYTAAYIRWSNPGVIHPGNQKFWYTYRGTGQSSGSMVVGFLPGASDRIKPNGQPQTSGGPGVMEPQNDDPRLPEKGEWFLMETLMVMNSSTSTSDGVFRIWIDGELLVSHNNVRYSEGGQALEWRECNLNPYFGGGAMSTRSFDTNIFVDHAFVSTSTTR